MTNLRTDRPRWAWTQSVKMQIAVVTITCFLASLGLSLSQLAFAYARGADNTLNLDVLYPILILNKYVAIAEPRLFQFFAGFVEETTTDRDYATSLFIGFTTGMSASIFPGFFAIGCSFINIILRVPSSRSQDASWYPGIILIAISLSVSGFYLLYSGIYFPAAYSAMSPVFAVVELITAISFFLNLAPFLIIALGTVAAKYCRDLFQSRR